MKFTYTENNRISRETLHQIIFVFLHTVRDNISDILYPDINGIPFITGDNSTIDNFIENNLEQFLAITQKLSGHFPNH